MCRMVTCARKLHSKHSFECSYYIIKVIVKRLSCDLYLHRIYKLLWYVKKLFFYASMFPFQLYKLGKNN